MRERVRKKDMESKVRKSGRREKLVNGKVRSWKKIEEEEV